jgi:hypothetical protein
MEALIKLRKDKLLKFNTRRLSLCLGEKVYVLLNENVRGGGWWLSG